MNIPKEKKILDPCCGGRTFWFDKHNKKVLFTDIRREEEGFIKARPRFSVNPDEVMDFRHLEFPDNSFKMVVFDPPHLKHVGASSWMAKKYGYLSKDWKEDLQKGFAECFRVLEEGGVLVFKWSERDIKIGEVLKLTPYEPLFGHTTGRSGSTKWVCFMK